MGLFKNIKIRFVIKKKIHDRYKPFFISLKKNLSSTVILSIDKDITDIYNQIKTLQSKKFFKEAQKYETLLSEIKKHNETIKIIDKGIRDFNYGTILNNPYLFNYSDIYNKYDDLVNLINTFKNKTDVYDKFLNDEKTIKDYYNIIKEQYDLITEYERQIRLDDNIGYLNSSYRDSLLLVKQEFKQRLNSYSVLFYNLDNDLEVINLIKSHNDKYIKLNTKDIIFNNINGKILDFEQRESILTDEISTLVVAGAGSGKTLTICGKVKYLIERENIKPEDILLLSYSRSSAEDLQNKVSKISSELNVGTFHKIGLDILKEVKEKTFTIEEQYGAIIEKYFREELPNRPEALRKILTYYGLYISSDKYNSDKHNKKYKTKGELYEDLKKNEYYTLKSQIINNSNILYKKETIKKELVKSLEELAIANWYFINGIDYIYEKPYEVDVSTEDKRQYLPDFYLPEYKIYHEHYGVDKNGNAKQYVGEEAEIYVQNMQWKRNTHKQYNTICIETYSYEFQDGSIFDKLEKTLKEKGVAFKPLNNEQIYNSVKSIYEGKVFKSFINLVKTFLSLYKATYRNKEEFENFKNKVFSSNYERKKAVLFLDIVCDIYNYYISYIRNENKIDFDDMILQATLELHKSNRYKYKYIIVDEFQDISFSRMLFLKKLIEHGNSKLFAVGDDWQAIYRFSGCDLNIFLKFSDYFKGSTITKITNTHRNSQELQNIAGTFIKKNPEQFDKSINSEKHLDYPVQIFYYSENKQNAFFSVIKEINKINPKAEVLILGRNNNDFKDIELKERIYIDLKQNKDNIKIVKVTDYPSMKFRYSTIHSSKGLEAEFVIIINADDKTLGFPNKMEDDELLDLVLSSKSGYEYAEERRLWYVALTRTKNYTFILANKNYPSIFVKEIEDKCKVIGLDNHRKIDRESDREKITDISCPWCKTGKLVLRRKDSDGSRFYSCMNYPYCKYTINKIQAVQKNYRCMLCGDFMVFKKSRWGWFLGCHNYPRCTYTEKYNPILHKIKT